MTHIEELRDVIQRLLTRSKALGRCSSEEIVSGTNSVGWDRRDIPSEGTPEDRQSLCLDTRYRQSSESKTSRDGCTHPTVVSNQTAGQAEIVHGYKDHVKTN